MTRNHQRRSMLAMTSAALAATVTRAHAEGGSAMRFDFEDATVGQLPAGITAALTGGGGPVKWSVIEDTTAPAGGKVLAQTSADRTDHRFPLAVFDSPIAADLTVGLKFKAVAGAVDRAAGIALRLGDARNYYVVRANALEDNVRLYKVVAGERLQFAGASAKVTSGSWHQLALAARGSRFEVLFNGKRLFTAMDVTFTVPGRVALWTKADSVTYFDDIAIETL
ncbi:hypothetical protein BH11PSE3_BH11PSE3_08280 [soil metagenome]